jgi:hypothetical protein
MNRIIQAAALAATVSISASANALTIEVQADKPGPAINPAMWGIFFTAIP